MLPLESYLANANLESPFDCSKFWWKKKNFRSFHVTLWNVSFFFFSISEFRLAYQKLFEDLG